MDEESESPTPLEASSLKNDSSPFAAPIIAKHKPLASSSPTATVKDVKILAKKTPMSKEESKQVTNQIWARVFRHYEWVILAILGGMGFGSVFPGTSRRV